MYTAMQRYCEVVQWCE